jgi:hypothetical protein
MGSERARRRCLEKLDALVRAEGDRDAMRVEAIGLLRTGIGFERWCTLVLDPDSLVLGQGIGHNDWQVELPRLNLLAAGGEDVNSPGVLARSRDPVGVLSAATGGDLVRSARWREVLAPYGVGDELLCIATDELGAWGDVILYRDSDDPPFDAEDAQLMRRASALLARACGGMRSHRGRARAARRPEPACSCSTPGCGRQPGPARRANGSPRSARRRRRSRTACRRSSGTSSAGCSRSNATRIRAGPRRCAPARPTAAGR